MIVKVGVRQRKWPTRIYETNVVGYIDLSNLDVNDNIPYKRYYDGKDIFNYLTFIGQAKIKSMYMVPTDELYDITILHDDELHYLQSTLKNEYDINYDCYKEISKYATPLMIGDTEGIPNKYLNLYENNIIKIAQ